MSQPVFRYDTLHFPVMKKTKEGYLRGKSTVTKTGVQKYVNFDGTVRFELRHPDDVFKKESLDSLKMIPVTHEHPPFMLNVNTASKFQIGSTGEEYTKFNDAVAIGMTITDPKVIEIIMHNKKRDLSAGYQCKLIEEVGVYDGQEYTHRQIDIFYNHISLVRDGRAGKSVCIRTDSLGSEMDLSISNNLLNKEDSMENENEQLKYDAMESKLDATNKENEILKLKLEKVQNKFDSIEKAYEETKKELTEEKAKRIDSAIQDGVRRSLKSLIFGSSALGDPMAYISHSPREIMIAAINAKLAGERKDAIDFSNKSDEVVEESFNARFNVDSHSVTHADCKHLIGNLYQKYDHSHTTSLGQKIQQYEMTKKPNN